MKRMTKLAAAGAGLALIAGAAVATPAIAATTTTDGGPATCAPWPGGFGPRAGGPWAGDGGLDAGGPSSGAPWAGALWSRLPADLRADLREARQAAPGDERRAAFEEIRENALAGEYGDDVQQFVQAHPGLGAGAWADAPQELKDDVRAALALSGDERRDAFAEIARAAVSGDYGAAVQERAQQMRNAPWWPGCGE